MSLVQTMNQLLTQEIANPYFCILSEPREWKGVWVSVPRNDKFLSNTQTSVSGELCKTVIKKYPWFWGPWVAPSVECPTLDFGSGHHLGVLRSLEMGSLLSAESAWDPVPPPPPPGPAPVCTRALTSINLKKKKNTLDFLFGMLPLCTWRLKQTKKKYKGLSSRVQLHP